MRCSESLDRSSGVFTVAWMALHPWGAVLLGGSIALVLIGLIWLVARRFV